MRASLTSFLSFGAAALSPSTTHARDQEQQQRPTLRRETASQQQQQQHHRLETREVEPGVFSVSVLSPADSYDGDVNARQRRRATVARKLEALQSCRLYLEDMHYSAQNSLDSEEKWVCTFENYVSEESGTPYPYALDLKLTTLSSGDNADRLRAMVGDAGATSGQSVLRWDSLGKVGIDAAGNTLTLNEEVSMVEGQGVWIVNDDDESSSSAALTNDAEDGAAAAANSDQIIRRSRSRSRRKLRTTGTMTAIIIRIVGDNVAPGASLTQLQEEVFGDGLSLRTQMERCSHGQLIIEPFTGYGRGYFQEEIKSGIIELRITTNPMGQSDKRMENDANDAASYVLGNLASQFDLVLFAIPPGVTPPFAAYAYIGTPFSYYSNNNIGDLMVQMHEIGHNLGLQHAGEGTQGTVEAEYGDKSGYMGYSGTEDPSMCYNAANNYQLGWYSQYSVRPTANPRSGGTFVVSGVAGYDPEDSSKFVTLRLEQPRLAADYYVGYNWASGMNTGTQEDRNRVIIVEKNGAVHDTEQSWKKAALGIGESYVIQNYDNSNRSVTVTFVRVELNDAIVDIRPEQDPSSAPSSAPSPSPSLTPTYNATFPETAVTEFNGTDSLYGNETDDDSLYGNNETDWLFGNDTDDDSLYGNNETDWLFGNETDDDSLYGNETDWLFGNETDDDSLYGNETDWIFGNGTFGNETDDDSLYGNNETDWIFGNGTFGNETDGDLLYGNNETDWIFGNETFGNETDGDLLYGNNETNWIFGNEAGLLYDNETGLLLRDEMDV